MPVQRLQMGAERPKKATGDRRIASLRPSGRGQGFWAYPVKIRTKRKPCSQVEIVYHVRGGLSSAVLQRERPKRRVFPCAPRRRRERHRDTSFCRSEQGIAVKQHGLAAHYRAAASARRASSASLSKRYALPQNWQVSSAPPCSRMREVSSSCPRLMRARLTRS